MKNHGLLPSETLFVDDSIQHIETANKLGVNTQLVSTNDNFIMKLTR